MVALGAAALPPVVTDGAARAGLGITGLVLERSSLAAAAGLLGSFHGFCSCAQLVLSLAFPPVAFAGATEAPSFHDRSPAFDVLVPLVS